MTKEMEIHIGPQGPQQPGPYQLFLTVDEEEIVDAEIDIGYVHKGVEKIAENRTYTGFIPLSDRVCYVDSVNNNQFYCQAIEELAGIEVSERAKYLRVLFMEMQRLISHYVWLGEWLSELGWFSFLLWGFRDREHILKLFEETIGGRLNMSTHRVGGVRKDITEDMIQNIYEEVETIEERVKEYKDILTDNSVFINRTKDVGKMSEREAKELGVVGPVIRGSGVQTDIRKLDPYAAYDQLNFDVPSYKGGDAYARTMVRLDEMLESIKIIRQVLDDLPEGDPTPPDEIPLLNINPPEGEVYTRVEAARGEFRAYLVSDGSDQPYRLKMSGPTYSNMQPLPKLLVGEYIADLYAIAGSLDFCVSEADR
ncbi:MAG: NADH dehydrogenase subunit D [Candidatus Methanohalarchaeum thermophilum]|uniref:NADH dehydrogenase subunit D n=1 Tax=Methanohalarchaeum thermophilum TaxID=1903181 RepID=A0A1Q6DX86_METT1|nr:MAG: NADH dehydrogenase subunit D [Candidatus Methanohalarchaeum thermophilum]